MKKLFFIIAFTLFSLNAHGIDYAKRFPTDTALPVVTPSYGDDTYARLDGTNDPFTGDITFSGNIILDDGTADSPSLIFIDDDDTEASIQLLDLGDILTITAPLMDIVTDDVKFGTGTTDLIIFNYDCTTHDGISYWIGDGGTSGYFQFNNDLMFISAGVQLFFQNTNNYISSDNADHIDLTAVTSIDLNAPAIITTGTFGAGAITGTSFTDGTFSVSSGNFTGVGNITGDDIDISAGTGDYTSTGYILSASHRIGSALDYGVIDLDGGRMRLTYLGGVDIYGEGGPSVYFNTGEVNFSSNNIITTGTISNLADNSKHAFGAAGTTDSYIQYTGSFLDIYASGGVGIGLSQTNTTAQKALDITGDINITQVSSPTASFTLTEDAGAYNLTTGTYYYAVEFVTATGDTSGYDLGASYKKSIVIGAANARVLITDLPVSTDPRVTARKIYRTTVGGSQYLLLRVTTIANNVDTSYTDNTADGSLDSADGWYRKDNTTTRGMYKTANGVTNLMMNLGRWNLSLGYAALDSTTTGTENIGIGLNALTALTTGVENYALGVEALSAITQGSGNIGIGYTAGGTQTTGSYNISVGNYAGRLTAAGANIGSVNIGHFAGQDMTAGDNYGVNIGYYAGKGFRGDSNIMIGPNCGKITTSAAIGGYNIFIGNSTGTATTVGADYNILIGTSLDLDVTGGDYQLNIGNLIKGNLAVGSEYVLISGPLYFTQTDGNEYIDSLNDGYTDIGATTGIRLNSPLTRVTGDLYVGNDADVNPAVVWSTDNIDGQIAFERDGDYFISSSVIRADESLYRRYYHIPAQKLNPGASGAAWVDPSANTIGGWRITTDAQILIFNADIHSDWDGVTDIIVEVYFAVGAAGNPNDTIDLLLTSYYNTVGDSTTKTQSETVITTTDGTANKVYKATFTINHDEVDNLVEAGDQWGGILNLVTATSEIDNAIITHAVFYYQTAHIGVESSDV